MPNQSKPNLNPFPSLALLTALLLTAVLIGLICFFTGLPVSFLTLVYTCVYVRVGGWVGACVRACVGGWVGVAVWGWVGVCGGLGVRVRARARARACACVRV